MLHFCSKNQYCRVTVQYRLKIYFSDFIQIQRYQKFSHRMCKPFVFQLFWHASRKKLILNCTVDQNPLCSTSFLTRIFLIGAPLAANKSHLSIRCSMKEIQVVSGKYHGRGSRMAHLGQWFIPSQGGWILFILTGDERGQNLGL